MSVGASDERRVRVCAAGELEPGAQRIVRVRGREVGLFNVAGDLYALHDRCPHRGGSLCRGPLTGTTATDEDGRTPVYDRAGRILRCSWHGWEFDVTTGRALVDPRVRARTYPVEVVDGDVYVVLRRDEPRVDPGA